MMSLKRKRSYRLGGRYFCIAASLLLYFAAPSLASESSGPHLSVDRSGGLRTADGLTLHLKIDLGSVEIQTLPPNLPRVVSYAVHLETDAPAGIAQTLLDGYLLSATTSKAGTEISGALPKHLNRAQFWVRYVVSVPANYNLEIATGAGDIHTTDIGGHVLLQTEGGNITAGRLNYRGVPAAPGDRPVAKLETQGGHIKVLDVTGDLDAYTAGGHVIVGNISGSAKLRTGGGHIRAGQIKGTAHLETAGGNITVGEAGTFVMVRTGGGQIDFGEVHGSVHAQTGGGGIRLMNVDGPMEVETSGGSICMTRITNTVHAATGDGTITAWISPESQSAQQKVWLPGPSQLDSSAGDIILFLPRNIAATIDATVESGGMHQIEADPSFPLSRQLTSAGQAHALGSLNGGGAVIKLRTSTGKIRLQYLDADDALRQATLEEQKSRIKRRLSESGPDQLTIEADPAVDRHVVATSPNDSAEKSDWQSWVNRFELTFTGVMREDQDEFRKHLLDAPPPDYPPLARRAGVQGVVRLQVRLKTDGTLSVEKVLEGEPVLVEAATNAILHWHASPEQFSGRKVEVISTVTFNFQLR